MPSMMENLAKDFEKDIKLPPLEKTGYKIDIIDRIKAIFTILCDLYGTDRLVLKASKLNALDLLNSTRVGERLLALQKIIMEDPTIDEIPSAKKAGKVLAVLEEGIAEQIALRTVEEELERKIALKMHERQEEYYQEIKMQILKENQNPENAQTLKKLAILEKKDSISLAKSAMEMLRPTELNEIVGQEKAVKALLSKLSSPYPQHIILYGPPGVGKTTAARIALDAAKKLKKSPFEKDAPFIEVNGATLRWDPREVTNPLLGSVHDPIYQGARKDLAESGIPEPKLGLVTEAHGGVLFIDEIGELDPILLNKLLKVLEDKRVEFESSYYDPNDDRIPQYIKKIFNEGAPADFVLISATTRSPDQINPAIRSRCAEIFFEPLSPNHIKQIVGQSASRLGIDLHPVVPEIISEYTIEGRKANNILADAYGLALYKQQTRKGRPPKSLFITKEDIYEVIQSSRLVPYVTMKANKKHEIGKVFGLGVSGFVGSVIEIEAVIFPAREKSKGSIRFNDSAGSMAKDSVFNAASVIRRITGEELLNYDVHINVIGGGNIDGPSAGLAICLVLLSCIKGVPLMQDIAITGEVSVQGRVKPVGGISEKIYGAKQAGMTRVIIPKENERDYPADLKGIEIVAVSTVEEALENLAIHNLQGEKVC
ncbi:Lon family ATP-dependent protease [Desulfitibacter alkalitolerans]|uniref:Lon family ATP-dependent protease n=1 Tax=Desulfitibacter alkalitolerans TaxID=264641 RepID=UPI000A062355|nr:Lon family ATP-dependent protease [Desulfitibacter alkalitolerans]